MAKTMTRAEAAERKERRLQREAEGRELARGPIDMPFFLLVLLLTGIGLVMLFSASFPRAYYKGLNPAYYLIRQGVFAAMPQGTYMLFLDCTEWCEKNGKPMDELLKAGYRVGVGWQDGRPFHGEHSIRMNLALPFTRVQEAFERLDKYVFNP